MEQIKSKEELVSGASFVKEESASYGNVVAASSNVKYDLIGKLVDETGLTRKAVIQILQGIQPTTFNQFKNNPEEFIIKAAALINDEKATAIIEHITYDVMDDKYGTDVFTDPTIKGRLGVNAMKAKKHLYDHIVYDSSNEQAFATELDTNTNVAVYVKLPDGFNISTPVFDGATEIDIEDTLELANDYVNLPFDKEELEADQQSEHPYWNADSEIFFD